MSRGVCSLSFDSPDVKDAIKMPGRSSMTIDSWAMPDWARERQMLLSKLDKRNRVYWAPDWITDSQTTEYMAALAVAMSNDDLENKIPSFPKLMHTLCKEGRISRVITKVYPLDGHGSPLVRFEYPPDYPINVLDVDSFAPGPKIEEVDRWLVQNPKEPLILSSVGNLGMYMLAKLLVKHDIKFEMIRGDVNKTERKRIVDDFENGGHQVCLLQQAAGAESITLIRATTSILIDHHWSSSIYTQFMARNYRIGQKEFCEHFDYQFGTMQGQVIRRLKRGELFDSRVRSQLEAKYWGSGSSSEVNNMKQ
jgi:superfamily II DNA or RNA helicase